MKLAYCAAAAVAALIATASASTASAQDVSFNVGVTSDYVFRGLSQTDESPALQAGVDVTFESGFYAGAWASNVDFFDDTDAEVDVYGGYRTEVSGFALDFGLVGYFYINEPSGADYNFVEFKAAASRAVGPVTLGAVVYYTPDYSGAIDDATYVEANAAWAFADKFTATAAVGNQDFDGFDYTTWNAGVAYALTDKISLDGRYHDTDVDTPLSDERFVASVKYTF